MTVCGFQNRNHTAIQHYQYGIEQRVLVGKNVARFARCEDFVTTQVMGSSKPSRDR